MKKVDESEVSKRMITCNKDCKECKSLNIKADNKGYPWGYECLKYGDSVCKEHFRDGKDFLTDGK